MIVDGKTILTDTRNTTISDTDVTGAAYWFKLTDENGDYVLNDSLKIR